MEKKCVIVGSSKFCEKSLPVESNDLLIAADGGYIHFKHLGLRPNLLVGDFDSLSFRPDDVEIVELPTRKDDTDMAKAVKIGLERGFNIFHLYGGAGGHISHTLANIQLLAYVSKRGGRAYLYGDDFVMTAVTNGSIKFAAEKAGDISVFAVDETAVVSEDGLEFDLKKFDLKNDFPLGVSNKFKGTESIVCVHKGTVLVVFSR